MGKTRLKLVGRLGLRDSFMHHGDSECSHAALDMLDLLATDNRNTQGALLRYIRKGDIGDLDTCRCKYLA